MNVSTTTKSLQARYRRNEHEKVCNGSVKLIFSNVKQHLLTDKHFKGTQKHNTSRKNLDVLVERCISITALSLSTKRS